jgi:hypothetical protein
MSPIKCVTPCKPQWPVLGADPRYLAAESSSFHHYFYRAGSGVVRNGRKRWIFACRVAWCCFISGGTELEPETALGALRRYLLAERAVMGGA